MASLKAGGLVLVRAWADHAGFSWLLVTALLVYALRAGVTTASPALWALWALWFLTTAQGLRRLWRLSRFLAAVLGLGIPWLALAIPFPHARIAWTDLVVFSPAAAAVVAELVVRRFRLGKGPGQPGP